jgi:hypothetical protein
LNPLGFVRFRKGLGMYRQELLQKFVNEEIKRTGDLIEKMEKRLRLLPEGSLFLRDEYLSRLFYQNGKKHIVSIPRGYRNRKSLISALQERQYIRRALPVLRKYHKKCRTFLDGLEIYDPQEIKRRMAPVYKNFDCSSICLDGDVDPDLWVRKKYVKNNAYPEKLIYCSEGGLYTRSKAEADIATKLEQYGLKFRYEEMLFLKNGKAAPDFTVISKHQRRVKHWEHLGMMDNPDYAVNAIEKLCRYSDSGIRLGENLIITWETKNNPLRFEQINDCIEKFLL